MLGIDELIVGNLSKIIDVIHEEGVGLSVAGKENDLGASCRERMSDCGTNARSSALYQNQPTPHRCYHLVYRDHDHFRVHQPLRCVACSTEVELQEIDYDKPWYSVDDGPSEGDCRYSFEDDFSEDWDRHGW